jgi:hypothetical protein
MSNLPQNLLLGFLLIFLTSCSPSESTTDSNQSATFDGAQVVPVPEQILLSEAIARQLETENEHHADYWRLYWSGDLGNIPSDEESLETAVRKTCNEQGNSIEFLPNVHRHFVPIYLSMLNFQTDIKITAINKNLPDTTELVDDQEIYRTVIKTSLAVRCPNKTMVNWRRMDDYTDGK